jgi:nucleoside-diphosphate-sugar epimerase
MLADRVLVTGADGFIGSHLVEMLSGRGARVRALCFYNSTNSWGWLDDSPAKKRVEIVTGDIRDPHFCERITKDIDVVYNLAALIAIP